MISSLQSKAKVTLQYLYLILSKFFHGTIKGIKFFSIQIIIWMVIERFLYLIGYRYYYGRFGILAISLLFCVFIYTMLYNWFYSFVTVRLKNIFVPYIIYAGLVYLGIVQENDWNFKIVTIDEYMLMGWLIPLYGLSIFILKKMVKKWLCHYPNILSMSRKVLNILVLLFVIFILVLILI